jgi:hypothetical protein
LDLPSSGQQHRQRTTEFQRELTHGFGQLKGQHLVLRDPASVEALDGSHLSGA